MPITAREEEVMQPLIWDLIIYEHSINNEYDIIYYFDEFSAFFSNYSEKKFHHKVVVLIHEVAITGGSLLSKIVQKRALKNADLILTNTKENLMLLRRAVTRTITELEFQNVNTKMSIYKISLLGELNK